MRKEEVFKQAVQINGRTIENDDFFKNHLENGIWPRVITGLDVLKSRGLAIVDDDKTLPCFNLNDLDPIQLRINNYDPPKTDEQNFSQNFSEVRKAMIANQASSLVEYEYIEDYINGTSEKVIASEDRQPKDPIRIYFGPGSNYIRSVVESMVKEEGIPVVRKV